MAKQDRIVSNWLALARSFNYDIKAGGAAMLARARELFANDPYTKKIVRSFKKGIVGPDGFVLRNKAGEWQSFGSEYKFIKDDLANGMINEAWYQYGVKKYCSVEEDETFRHYSGTLAQTVFVDGEVFIRKLAGKFNPYGFTTQLITSEQVDWKLIKSLPNGNFIIMGIEVTPYYKKIAYWVRKHSPKTEVDYGYTWTNNYDRIPADQMIHLFNKETVHQLRGITQLAPVGIRLKMLYQFEESALTKALASARIPGVISKQLNQNPLDGPGIQVDSKDGEDNWLLELEDGQYLKVKDGYEMKPMDSDYPHPLHKSFTDTNLHGVSAGVDMAYHTVASDYSQVNYTSSRTALLDERDGFKDSQSWFAENLLSPFFTAWLEMAIISGQLNLPITKLEKFDKPYWIGRRWDWVDPRNEAEANIIALQSFQKTFESVLAERGLDLDEQLQEVADEKQKFADKGLGDLYELLMTKYTAKDTGQPAPSNGNGKAYKELHYQ